MSFKKYKTYSSSEILWMSALPTHWDAVKVRRLFEIKKRIVGEIGFDVLSITQKGMRVKDTESNDGQLSMDYSKYQRVEPGDFAMNHMDLLTGYVDISEFSGVTSPDYRVFSITDPSTTCDRYFLYLFQHGYKAKLFFPFGQGSSQLGRWRLPADEFKGFLFPLPPIGEQEAIATFLDRETAKIDALVAEQEKLIALLKEKRQAVISHAVTKGLDSSVPTKDSGVEWIGEIPEHWHVAALKRACTLIKDGTHLPPTRVTFGVPLLSVRNVQRSIFGFLDDDSLISEDSYQDLCRSFIPRPNDVLLAIVGATLGKTALIPDGLGKFHIQRSLAVFRPTENVMSEWLHFVFQSVGFQSLLWEFVGYSAQPGIYLGTLAQFYIPSPQLHEQRQIVGFLKGELLRLDELDAEAKRTTNLLQERRTALISAAVTGQIDVRGMVQQKAKEELEVA